MKKARWMILATAFALAVPTVALASPPRLSANTVKAKPNTVKVSASPVGGRASPVKARVSPVKVRAVKVRANAAGVSINTVKDAPPGSLRVMGNTGKVFFHEPANNTLWYQPSPRSKSLKMVVPATMDTLDLKDNDLPSSIKLEK